MKNELELIGFRAEVKESSQKFPFNGRAILLEKASLLGALSFRHRLPKDDRCRKRAIGLTDFRA